MKKVFFVLLMTVFVVSGCKFGAKFEPLTSGAKSDQITTDIMKPEITTDPSTKCALNCEHINSVAELEIDFLKLASEGTSGTSSLKALAATSSKATALSTTTVTTTVDALSPFTYGLLTAQLVFPKYCACGASSKDQINTYMSVLDSFVRQSGLTCKMMSGKGPDLKNTAQDIFNVIKSKTSVVVPDLLMQTLATQLAYRACGTTFDLCNYELIEIDPNVVVTLDCETIYKEAEPLSISMMNGEIKPDVAVKELYKLISETDYCECGDRLFSPLVGDYLNKTIFGGDNGKLLDYCAKTKETGDLNYLLEFFKGYDIASRGIDPANYDMNFLNNIFCLNTVCDVSPESALKR